MTTAIESAVTIAREMKSITPEQLAGILGISHEAACQRLLRAQRQGQLAKRKRYRTVQIPDGWEYVPMEMIA